MLNVFLIILGILIAFFIIKTLVKKSVKNSLNWEKPILLSNEIQTNEDFRKIILNDMNQRIADGAEVLKEGNEIPSYLSVDRRNFIYHNTHPQYEIEQVYSTVGKTATNSYFIIYIWIKNGITYDAPYEIKYE